MHYARNLALPLGELSAQPTEREKHDHTNCASAKLVIELDGSQHYEPQGMAYDSARSAFLTALGLEVLRFSNRDVDRDFRGVCTQIDITIQKRLQGPLSHLR